MYLQYLDLEDWNPITTTPYKNHDVTQLAAACWLHTLVAAASYLR